MAKKNKKVTLIEKATKKAKVNATAKKATSAVKGSSASTKKKAAEEAKKKAEELKKKREAAKRSQESAMKNTKATQKKRGAVLSDKSTAKKQASKRANNLLADIKKTTNVGEAKKAVEKGQQKSALGTKVEKKTGTVEVQKYSHPRTREKVEYEYTPLTMQEYGKQTTAAMTGQYRNLMKSDKELNKKVSDLNVKDYANSPGVMGALDQMTQGLSVSEDPIYNYNESQKKIMDSQKQTGRYNVGRAVGAVAEFGLGGTGTIGSSIAKTAGKTALKEAAEQGGKQLVKTTAKNVGKEALADTFVSSGLNLLDALKFSYKDGKIDKNEFWKEVAFNTAGDLLIGGVVSGVVHGLSAGQISKFNKISKKKASGKAVTEAEQRFFDRHVKELTSNVEKRLKQLKEEDARAVSAEQPTVRTEEPTVRAEEPTVRTEAEQPRVEAETPTVRTEAEQPTVRTEVEEPTVRAEQTTTEAPTQTADDLARQVDEMRRGGATDDEILEQLEAQGVEPYRAITAVEGGVEDLEWKAVADEASVNTTKVYDTGKEKIKGENPTPTEIREKSKTISQEEYSQAKQTAVKLKDQAKDDVADIIEPYIRDGRYDKKFVQSQADAMEQAKEELANGSLYQNFMDSNATNNEHLFMARTATLLEDLFEKAPNSDEATEQMLKVMDKATDASSLAGRLLNATKLLYRSTPEGRVRLVTKEIDKLNKKFADRLKGKKIELTDEQIERIYNATEDDIEEVMDDINMEVWEQIPATWFERFNELRHTSMLFNAKTHFRNLGGNSVFYLGRLLADAIEIAAYNMPGIGKATTKRVKELGGKVEMVHVTRKEIADNKKVVDDIFNKNYKKSNSQNKYVETTRPHGVTAVKNKYLKKIVNTNYGLLEKEDLIAFKPEYRKNFIRWCKANDVELNDIPNMSKEQMQKADLFAMKKAEEATFRDDSAFAKKIVGLKETTATKKGKSAIGTAAYRTGNIALESVLPFVKTPVNILRRSVDYSPVGLLRSTVELATAKNADQFMKGVHSMATGLTGSGIFALGMLLAKKDLITVQAGEESGDAYYDRDMGYQDYSLVVGGDNKYSVTIDWLSPMQVSLFMGATAFNSKEGDDSILENMFDGLTAIAGPMLDMSFMSSAKDTIEMFTEKVYRNGTGDDADWSGAIAQTLFGSIPQGYLGGFVPQLFSQTAQALDSKQRDTRSTLEDPIAASWESFGRKLANKIPVLRNKILNPKLDRFGNDIETGNNILMRFVNAYANPSNVKKINFTELDKEIISIYNHIEDDTDDKRFFYYNFTGNPSYDLSNGKRMSYDEAYKYGKEKRIQQTISIKEMTKAKSYKNMTWEMKADEVGDAHWIAQAFADRKTYGNKFAVNRVIKSGSETDKRAAEVGRSMGVKDKDFMDFYLTKEKLISRSHDSGYNTKALAVALSGNDKMAAIYDINIDKVKAAKEYLKNGGSEKEYSNASCDIMSAINKAKVTVSNSNKAFAAAKYEINERTYSALGIDEQKANMGVGLTDMGYTFAQLQEMKMEAKYGFDANQNGSISKYELMAYIDSLGIDSTEEKACLFEYLKSSNANNPYGSVPDYLNFGGTSSSGGSGRGYSRGGGGGSSKSKKSPLGDWDSYVRDIISSAEKTAGVNFKDWDSPLDKSYQNKINSIIKKMEV